MKKRGPKKHRPYERVKCLSKKRYTKIGAKLAKSKYGGTVIFCEFCKGYHHRFK